MTRPFKLKSSPTKGRLDDFFKSLGREGTEARLTKQVQENQGMTNFEKRQAEKAAQRKTGKSKFQRSAEDRKKRKAATAAGDAQNAADKTAREAATAKLNAEIATPPPSTPPPPTDKKITGAIGSKTRKEQYDAKGWRYDDTIKGYNRDGTKIKTKVKTKVKKTKLGGVDPKTGNVNLDYGADYVEPTSKKKPTSKKNKVSELRFPELSKWHWKNQ